MVAGMDEWDDIVATGFQFLSESATYIVKDTGQALAVRIIPIDEAETTQARKGNLTFTGTKRMARLWGTQFPEGWAGVKLDDVVVWKGRSYMAKLVREEQNDVHLVELVITRR